SLIGLRTPLTDLGHRHEALLEVCERSFTLCGGAAETIPMPPETRGLDPVAEAEEDRPQVADARLERTLFRFQRRDDRIQQAAAPRVPRPPHTRAIEAEAFGTRLRPPLVRADGFVNWVPHHVGAAAAIHQRILLDRLQKTLQ